MTQLWNIVEAMLVFMPVGAVFYTVRLYRSRGDRLETWPRAWQASLLSGLIALCLEIAQIWLPARTPHIEDVLFAMLGGFAGVSCVRLLAAFFTGNSQHHSVNLE